jgi:hypothetical protein
MAINLNDTTPSAPALRKNVKWQKDALSPEDISAYFDQDVSVAAVSANGTMVAAAIETIERVTTSSSTITRTLPAATGSWAIFLSKKVDSGAGTVVVAGAGSPADSIDGGPNYTLVNQYQYVRLLDAAAGVWDIIGGN